jgi:hypothetical protein
VGTPGTEELRKGPGRGEAGGRGRPQSFGGDAYRGPGTGTQVGKNPGSLFFASNRASAPSALASKRFVSKLFFEPLLRKQRGTLSGRRAGWRGAPLASRKNQGLGAPRHPARLLSGSYQEARYPGCVGRLVKVVHRWPGRSPRVKRASCLGIFASRFRDLTQEYISLLHSSVVTQEQVLASCGTVIPVSVSVSWCCTC